MSKAYMSNAQLGLSQGHQRGATVGTCTSLGECDVVEYVYGSGRVRHILMKLEREKVKSDESGLKY